MTRPLLFRCISGQSALHRLNGSLNNGVIRHIRQGNMILTLIELVVLGSSGQSILIAGQARRETPTMVSQGIAILKMVSTRSEPSRTMPKPPLMAFPIPVPPPLCSAM